MINNHMHATFPNLQTETLETRYSHMKAEYHKSVGAIIARNDRYLIIDRVKPPFGYAGIAGHVEQEESPEEAIRREVREESGLEVIALRLVKEGLLENNACSRGVKKHYWHVYECDTIGTLRFNEIETKSIGWYTKNELAALPLEPAWRYWFEQTGILNREPELARYGKQEEEPR